MRADEDGRAHLDKLAVVEESLASVGESRRKKVVDLVQAARGVRESGQHAAQLEMPQLMAAVCFSRRSGLKDGMARDRTTVRACVTSS